MVGYMAEFDFSSHLIISKATLIVTEIIKFSSWQLTGAQFILSNHNFNRNICSAQVCKASNTALNDEY